MAPSRAFHSLSRTVSLHRLSTSNSTLAPKFSPQCLRIRPSPSTRQITYSTRPSRMQSALATEPIVRSFPALLSSTCRTTGCSTARLYSTPAAAETPDPPDYLNEKELHIFNKIKGALEPVKLEVQDISGGCGSMYALQIESPKFKGLSVIKQHKMVNEVLKEEIAGWHGVQLRTKAAA